MYPPKTKHKIFVDGKTLNQISEESGVPLATVQHRHLRGARTYEELTSWENLHDPSLRAELAVGPGARVYDAMIEKGLSLTQLAERSRVSRSTVFEFIFNGRDISSMKLAKICGVLGLSMDYVMGLRRQK